MLLTEWMPRHVSVCLRVRLQLVLVAAFALASGAPSRLLLTACAGCLCLLCPVRFVEYAEDRSTRESQRFWFSVMDADGDGRLSWADMKLLYDAVQRSCSGGMLLHFEDLMNQIRDMVARQRQPGSGFTAQEMWECKLGAGVIGLLTNANNMLLQRSTAEWGRGEPVWGGYCACCYPAVDALRESTNPKRIAHQIKLSRHHSSTAHMTHVGCCLHTGGPYQAPACSHNTLCCA